MLAAGTSTRMGRPKALVTVGGRRMLDQVLEHLREAGIDRIVVVLGHRAKEVRAAVDLSHVTVVENADFVSGMAGSLRAGVRAVEASARHVMIVLADQPFVRPETIRHLASHAEGGGGAIYLPTYKGVWGNPVVFDTRLAPELDALTGDVGCRAMFPNHTAEIREVPVDDPGILVDIDSEEELREIDAAITAGAPVGETLDRLAEPRWSLHAAPSEHPVPRRLARRPDIPALAQELRGRGVSFAIATVVRAVRPTSGRPGYQAIVREDGSHVGWVGGACTEDLLVAEARAAIAAGTPRLLRVAPGASAGTPEEGVVTRPMTCQSGGTVEIFIEPHSPKPTLVIVGDSPVATSLATLGPVVGFRVVLVAPRAEPSELPEVDELVREVEQLPRYLSPSSFAVVASMGKYDELALLAVVRAPVAFAGLVASRKRAQSVFAALREEGATDAQIARVRNPVGLDIAASTPEEIALSILAEITRTRRTAPPASPAPVAADPRGAPEAIDPVCRMTVETSTPLRATHAGATYYFCSDGCRRKFARSPAKFLAAGTG